MKPSLPTTPTRRTSSEPAPSRHPNLREPFRRAREQPVRILPVLQHLTVNPRLVVHVETHSGEELQPKIAIAIDLRVGKPRTQHWLVSGERREQLRRRI